MLTHTFCHVRGIGAASERKLWIQGCHTWSHAFDGGSLTMPPARRARLCEALSESRSRLDRRDFDFFAGALPAREHWRLFPHVRDSVLYFDIETTGLDAACGHVTTIATFDGGQVRHYVHGRNLDDFATDLRGYRAVVTFNGKTFDAPFVERSLGARLPAVHIDLRHVLRGLGFAGGLKACERRLGMARDDLADVDGFMAVQLWHYHRRRASAEALETLLAYNVQDAINLQNLMIKAYNMKVAATPFRAELALAEQPAPANPFRAHRAIVNELTGAATPDMIGLAGRSGVKGRRPAPF